MPYRTKGTCMGEVDLVPYPPTVRPPRAVMPSPRQPCQSAPVYIHLLDIALCYRIVGIEGSTDCGNPPLNLIVAFEIRCVKCVGVR